MLNHSLGTTFAYSFFMCQSPFRAPTTCSRNIISPKSSIAGLPNGLQKTNGFPMVILILEISGGSFGSPRSVLQRGPFTPIEKPTETSLGSESYIPSSNLTSNFAVNSFCDLAHSIRFLTRRKLTAAIGLFAVITPFQSQFLFLSQAPTSSAIELVVFGI